MTSPQLQRALLLIEQGRHELAIPELRGALATDPDAALPHALLAVCLADGEQFAEAQDEAQRAIALAPDLPFAHYALAHVLHDRRDFKPALDAVREAIRLEPEDADFHALEAQIHLANYRWPEALAAAMGLDLLAPAVHQNDAMQLAKTKVLSSPVKNNRTVGQWPLTAVLAQFGKDDHFAIFDNPIAAKLYQGFLLGSVQVGEALADTRP